MASVYGFARTLGHYAPSGALAPYTIRVYQITMALRGFGPQVISAYDGIMGPTTAAAIRAFQADSNLPVTGTFDDATVAALARETQSLVASGRDVYAAADAAARANATAARSSARAVGTHPTVTAITTAQGPVAVPESVSKMIPPASVAQLQTMPAPQVQAFVADLATKVATGQAQGNELVDEGTGKDVAITAVPVIGPNGTVTAGIATAPAGWWPSLSDNQKVAVIAGGALVGMGAIAAVWSIASAKKRK